MSAPKEKNSSNAAATDPVAAEQDRDWTVMFLFAGDNELSPLFVSQLKNIKDALSHPKVDVVIQFDPAAPGVATKLLHVNRNHKGNGNSRPAGGRGSSFVTSMDEDTIRGKELDKEPGPGARKMKELLKSSDSVPATEALETFLDYCREKFPAKNYVLFLVGHGLVVGNDAFLPDKHPASSIKLRELGDVLRAFSDKVNGTLQLLALHSCAMSAVEVAYELRKTAKYMLGSEGIAYVGSYPYRNLLLKLFNTVDASATANVEQLVEKLYLHALHNTTDFTLMGYSLDLSLCSLEPERYVPLTKAIKALVSRLKEAIQTDRGRELILLAHWEAQSYWDENYTDLYDFCLCLKRRCKSPTDGPDESEGGPTRSEKFEMLTGLVEAHRDELPADMRDNVLKLADEFRMREALATACGDVMSVLSPKGSNERATLADGVGPIILRSDNSGTKYQYSHGLSVYFPWSRPLDTEPPPPLAAVAPGGRRDAPKATGDDRPHSRAIENYKTYKFSQEEFKDGLDDNSWLSFLELYFTETQRAPRRVEAAAAGWAEEWGEHLFEAREAKSFAFQTGALAKETGSFAKETGSFAKETGSFGECSCPSIKNYPTEEFVTEDERKIDVRAFSCTRMVLERGE